MIGTWPDPYPNELFHSICARYLEQANFSSRISAIAELFGTDRSVQEYQLAVPVSKLLWENEDIACGNKQQAGGGNQ